MFNLFSTMGESRRNHLQGCEKPECYKLFLEAKMMPSGPAADKRLLQAALKGEKAAAVEIAQRFETSEQPDFKKALYFYAKAVAPKAPHELSDLSLYACAKAEVILKEHVLDQKSLMVKIAKRILLHAPKAAEAPLFGG
jgi:hypothetical protein